MPTVDHRTFFLGHITDLYLLAMSEQAIAEFRRAVPALVALFKLEESKGTGSARKAWRELPFSDAPGDLLSMDGSMHRAQVLIAAAQLLPRTADGGSHTYVLEHITDLWKLAGEHVAAFQRDLPTLVATLQVAATAAYKEKGGKFDLAEVFPHITFAPEMGDVVMLRTAESTRLATGDQVRAAAARGADVPTPSASPSTSTACETTRRLRP